jgi:hypothetical protein
MTSHRTSTSHFARASARPIERLESRTLFAAVPAPFTPVSIGATNVAGVSSFDSTTSTITITAANQDAFTTNAAIDSIYFVYAKLIGNGSITTRVDDVDVPASTDPLGGLDIRSSLATDAQNVFIANRSQTAVIVNNRATDGANGVNQSITSSTPNPVYVELQRTGDVITELYSTDGSSFTTLGTATLTGLPNTVLIGFAQGSQNESVASTATYDHFSTTGEVVSATPGPGPTAVATISNVTTSTGAVYSFPVTYMSSNYVSAASIGNGNIIVTGPNGYSQAATVVPPAPTSDAMSTTVHYALPTPSYPGTYTITLEPNQISDAAGNVTSGQVLGTFTVPFIPSVTGTITNAKHGTPLAGIRVYFDIGNTGTETAADPWAVTDSSGDYEFGPAGDETYRVAIQPTAGETVATPTIGYSTQTTSLGETQTGVNFTLNVPGPDVTGAFTALPAAIKRGKSAKLTLQLTDTGSAAAKGTITIELASNTTNLADGNQIVFKTFKKKINLAAGASITLPTSFTVPKKTTPAGARYILGLIDTTHVIDSVTDIVTSASTIPFV